MEAAVTQFGYILNWTLKAGSHQFPGPDGGTCINEAAIVAAGFPYQPVWRVEVMPRCFSRPICRLAMLLNDEADDVQRQRLLPFVTRLACADAPEVERLRQNYINARTSGRPLNFENGMMALEGALAIGRQATLLSGDEVSERLDQAKCIPEPATPDRTMIGKIKEWLGIEAEVS
ncbi:conserved hypothetical protein [Methylobacterium sp. 4-46]|uniref:hypothetical protein n=1 Tax=unclassified Methylobacterium TaxID=2615210 RepID=UPI000165C718|nr:MULTISPECIES: hypothetical protein [Methylobacterium]ACA18373.1 conserved hypothetical protein [Methylobacterium sp. 4-46]WFT77667.1 hypothetical protein QA634_20370 [Methylobacterium nodulans]